MQWMRTSVFFVTAAVFLSALQTLSAQKPEFRLKNRFSSSYALLEIKANVSAADVYVNNVRKGSTPLTIKDILPGHYTLRMEKEGFYTQTLECSLESGSAYKVYAELKKITGTLRIRADSPDAVLYVDGNKADDNFLCFYLGAKPKRDDTGKQRDEKSCEWTLQLAEGEHLIEVKSFGTESARSQVYLFRETEVQLDFHLQQADFALTSFSSARTRFNPCSPGAPGVCRFDFSVTAPGNGILEIHNAQNESVYRQDLPPFTREHQSTVWDGLSEDGKPLANGRYTAYLKTRGADDRPYNLSPGLPIDIDSTLLFPPATPSAGGLSSGLVPAAHLMPPKSFYGAVSAGADFSVQDGFKSAPLFLSGAYTPLKFLEMSYGIGTEIVPQKQSPFVIQGALKAAGRVSSFYYGALIRGAYSSHDAVSLFNETGAAAGVLLGTQYAAGSFSLHMSASEEACFGDRQGKLSPFGGNLKTGVSCAMRYRFFTAHISSVLLSPFNSSGIRAFGVVHSGAEFSVFVPKTAFMPLAGFYYSYTEDNKHGVSFRAGSALFF